MQQTDSMKELLKKHKTFLVNVPPGCTSRVQVVHVLINKPFKDEVRPLSEDHLDENLDQYIDGKINASQQRVLTTKWVGDAWSKVGKMKDSIISSFTKWGLSVAFDGSENNEVNIEGLGPYIYDIHEKCPIFASPSPPFSVCPNGSELGPALGRRSLGYRWIWKRRSR